jgi:hypothetical protein
MPLKTMNVSLPLSGPGDRLSVGDAAAQNQILANAQATTISWTLTGALAQADFVPMTAAEPGFSWLSPAPPTQPAIFGTAVISNNGDTISITDNHLDATTAGQWAYMLRVVYNGQVYATTNNLTKDPSGTVNRPVIINK